MQASVVLSTAAKYTLACIDAALEGRWEGKVQLAHFSEGQIWFVEAHADFRRSTCARSIWNAF